MGAGERICVVIDQDQMGSEKFLIVSDNGANFCSAWDVRMPQLQSDMRLLMSICVASQRRTYTWTSFSVFPSRLRLGDVE